MLLRQAEQNSLKISKDGYWMSKGHNLKRIDFMEGSQSLKLLNLLI